jgi:hypothetical protein
VSTFARIMGMIATLVLALAALAYIWEAVN